MVLQTLNSTSLSKNSIATFSIDGLQIRLISVHLRSKSGAGQNCAQREAQAYIVRQWVSGLRLSPTARLARAEMAAA